MAGGILPTGEAPTLAAAAPPCQRPAPPAGVGTPPFRGRFERMIRRRPGARRGRSAMKGRSEEHTSELQSLMRISYAVFCLKNKNQQESTPLNDTKKHNT